MDQGVALQGSKAGGATLQDRTVPRGIPGQRDSQDKVETSGTRHYKAVSERSRSPPEGQRTVIVLDIHPIVGPGRFLLVSGFGDEPKCLQYAQQQLASAARLEQQQQH